MSRTSVVVLAALAVGLSGCTSTPSLLNQRLTTPIVYMHTGKSGVDEFVSHVYAEALRRSGFIVDMQSTGSSPDDSITELEQGEITLAFGYTGDLLTRYDTASPARAAKDVYADMVAALADGVQAGDYSPAATTPMLVINDATSNFYDARSIDHISLGCPTLSLGVDNPRTATDTIETINEMYSCEFGSSQPVPKDSVAKANLVSEGRIDAVIIPAADPALDRANLVELLDDKGAFRAENLVALYAKGSLNDRQLVVINRISGELDTGDLRRVQPRLSSGALTSREAANQWLSEHDY